MLVGPQTTQGILIFFSIFYMVLCWLEVYKISFCFVYRKMSWTPTFVILFSSNLVFYKDQKAAAQVRIYMYGRILIDHLQMINWSINGKLWDIFFPIHSLILIAGRYLQQMLKSCFSRHRNLDYHMENLKVRVSCKAHH